MVSTFFISLAALTLAFNAGRIGRLIRSRGRSWPEERKSEIYREFLFLFLGCLLGSMIYAAVFN